jgi:hypothetical protein
LGSWKCQDGFTPRSEAAPFIRLTFGGLIMDFEGIWGVLALLWYGLLIVTLLAMVFQYA